MTDTRKSGGRIPQIWRVDLRRWFRAAQDGNQQLVIKNDSDEVHATLSAVRKQMNSSNTHAKTLDGAHLLFQTCKSLNQKKNCA